VTTANKVRESVANQAATKNPGFFGDIWHSFAMWLKARGLSDRVPTNVPERKLKAGGSFRVDNGIQELVLTNGFALLAFEGVDGLQLSIVDAKHRSIGTLFRETYYSMPPVHIYDLSCGGTLEVSGDLQKVCTPDGIVVALDSRGFVLVSDGLITEQLKRPYLNQLSQSAFRNLTLLHSGSAESSRLAG
jgi:hypothetical protein